MRGTILKNKRRIIVSEMTEEEHNEVNLYANWIVSKEKKILDEYAGQSIEEVPEKYREKIKKLREYGLGLKKENIADKILEFVVLNNRMPVRYGKKVSDMTEEEHMEKNLYASWERTREYKIFQEYKEKNIDEVPKEYWEFIGKLREFGIGVKEKTVIEKVIDFVKENRRLPKGSFSSKIPRKNLTISEMTTEQRYEQNLSASWRNSKEKEILEQYIGKSIDSVPEEYRETIQTLRSFGIGLPKKTLYEEVVEFLYEHNGRLMQNGFQTDGKRLKRKDMTKEQIDEVNLCQRWNKSEEKEVLEKYAGHSIDIFPKKYREVIQTLRSFGIGLPKKTTYEKVMEFLYKHGHLMQSSFSQEGIKLTRKDMTEEQIEEINLRQRWIASKEKTVLDEYAGQPIENVPEEYREKISKLREFGLGIKPSKLKQAKQNRDEAIERNNKAKELEGQVSEELKKRGKNHEEQ